MKKNIAEHIPLRERERFLKDNCDKVERMSYMKQFTDEEIVAMKNRLSTVSIDMDDIEDEKKEMSVIFKSKLDPMKGEKKTLLRNIKQKAQLVVEDCFKFIDQENEHVEFYNASGDLVESRHIAPEERQRNLFALRNGTED